MSYKFEDTIGGQLFAKLQKATADCIEYKGKSLTEWEDELNGNDAIAEAKHAKMIRTLCIVLVCTALTGCLATTKIIIQHDFPDDHINYEIQQGWTKEY